MSRLLSQAEANELIGSVQTGTIDLEPFNLGSIIDCVSYDFTKPHSLSRSFTNNLSTISDGFSKAASMTLSTYLRASVTVIPLEPRHIHFQEFVTSAGNPSCLGIINLDPLKGQSVLEIEASIIFSLVDKLMGGSGETLDNQREFTEIEIKVAPRVMEKLLADFAMGSKRFVEMKPTVSRIEHNPEYGNICSGSERVVALDYEINMGQFTGMIHFGIPVSSFESVIDLLDPVDEQPERSPEERRQDIETLKNTLRRVSLEVRVDIGETRIPISKVRNLREGDVVVLDNRVTAPVDIIVEGKRKFKGIPGLVNGKKAVRWTSVNIEGGGVVD